MFKYMPILLFYLSTILFSQTSEISILRSDSVVIKEGTDVIRLKADSYSFGKDEFKIAKEKKLRPVGTTILLESVIPPLLGAGAAFLGGLIGIALTPDRTKNTYIMGGHSGTDDDKAASTGAAIGYTLGIGTGGYLIAKGGYQRSSFWLSNLASVAGFCSGLGLVSVFDKERSAVFIPLITPILFTIIFNHIYGDS